MCEVLEQQALCQIASFSQPSTSESSLLLLPSELRQEIFSLVLADSETAIVITSCAISQHPSLSILLTCRQIYYETRLLPFQLNSFGDSRPWCVSNVDGTRRFLRGLLSWQVDALRKLKLQVSHTDLVTWTSGGGLREICELFQDRTSQLRELDIDIEGTRAIKVEEGAEWDDLFDVDSSWVKQGIVNLSSLKAMSMTIGPLVGIHRDQASSFKEAIKEKMPWCRSIEITVAVDESAAVGKGHLKIRDDELWALAANGLI